MGTKIRDGFISPQVWVAKRENKLVEVLGKLTPARVEYAENIFGGEKYMDGNTIKRDYSLLTLNLADGKGGDRKTARYNFSPNDFTALRRECEPSINYQRSYSKELTKRTEKDGMLIVRTVTIRFEYYRKQRNGEYELKNGQKQVSNYPWYIGITEQKGIPDSTGEKIKERKEFIQNFILLTSAEYQSMIDSVCRYIDVYAMAFGVSLLREKAKRAEEMRRNELKNRGGA